MAGAGRARNSGVSSWGGGWVGVSGGKEGSARGTLHGFDGDCCARPPQQTGKLGQSEGRPTPQHMDSPKLGGLGGLHLAPQERSLELGRSAHKQKFHPRCPRPRAGQGTSARLARRFKKYFILKPKCGGEFNAASAYILQL